MITQVPPRKVKRGLKSRLLPQELTTGPSAPVLQFRTFTVLWAISLLFIGCIIAFLLTRNHLTQARDLSFKAAHWSLLVIPAIVFVNGTLPYLGLKTENSYAMFSNLRTEGGKTNHFIVPVSAQMFDYQKQVVQILSATDPALQKLADNGVALVLFEFRNYVSKHQPEYIKYLLNGEMKIYGSSIPASQRALGENPYVLRKLMKFRPFVMEGPQPCKH